MFILLIMVTIGVAGAELTPWATSDCPSVHRSCRPARPQTRPDHCLHICNSTMCTLRVAIILPDNDFYIVNSNRTLEELKKAEVEARERKLLPDFLHVHYQLYDDMCEQAHATIHTIDAFSDCTHVIVGPICDYCLASTGRTVKFLNSHGTPLITPGGFSFDFVKNKTECKDEFYMLINTGVVDYQSFAEFFFLVMKKYNWKKYALTYEKYDQNEIGGEHGCQLLMKSVVEIIKNEMSGHQFFDGDINLFNVTYEKYLRRDVGVKYGIIPICASQKNTRKILLEAEKLKMTDKGEYVFFSFALYNNASYPSQPWYDPDDTEENNNMARKAYRSLFIFSPWLEATYAEENRTIEERRGMIYLDGVYDGFLLYSYALKDVLFANVTSISDVSPHKTLSGVDVVNKMLGYRFPGRRESVIINCNGQRVAKYALMQMNNDYNFQIVAEYNTIDKKLIIIRNLTWATYEAPSDTPICGYDESKCPSGSNAYVIVIVSILVSIIILVIFGIIYRRHTFEKEIESMLWKVKYEDIKFVENPRSPSLEYFLEKKGSLMTLLSEMDDSSLAGDRQLFTKVARFKENRVAIKKLKDIKIDLNRAQLKEMKIMKDLSNEHLVKFHGACLDPPNCCILTEYCPKGSLQDVLENNEINLDFMFRLSLIQDLVIGMNYLHRSDIKYHGCLKSSNCVVDSRLVLKITDFGMSFLRCYAVDNASLDFVKEDVHAHWEKQLWTAPELLRGQKLEVHEMQKADIYSFGIVVHEIMIREGVFFLGRCNAVTKQD